MSKKFKLRPEAFQRDLSANIRIVMLVIAGFEAAIVLISLWSSRLEISDLLDFETLIAFLSKSGQTMVIGVGVGIFLTFVVRENMKARKSVWDSFEVEIGDGFISRRQLNTPEIRLQRDEISTLEDKGNILTIYTTNGNRLLNIPKLLDGYDEVKETLMSWGKTLKSTQSRTAISYWASIGITLIGFLAVIFAFDPIVQAIATLATLGWLVYFYKQVERDENHDPKLRKSYLTLIGLIALIGSCKFLSLLFMFFAPTSK